VKYLKTFPNKKSKTGPPSWLLLFKDRPKIFKITKNLELFLLRCEASLRVSKVEDMQEEIRKRSSFSAVVRWLGKIKNAQLSGIPWNHDAV